MAKTVIDWLTGEVQRLSKEVRTLREALEAPAPEANSNPKKLKVTKVKCLRKPVERRPVTSDLRMSIRHDFNHLLKKHPKWTAYRCAKVVAGRVKRNVSTVVRVLGDVYTAINEKRGNRFQEAAK